MKIQLESWKIINLNFEYKNTQKENNTEKNSFKLRTGQVFPDDNKYEFNILFEVNLKDNEYDLFIEAIYLYKLDEEITEQFKISDFPKINAPAIAFPYLRAFISNLTLQAGYKPVILPSINFVKLSKDNK